MVKQIEVGRKKSFEIVLQKQHKTKVGIVGVKVNVLRHRSIILKYFPADNLVEKAAQLMVWTRICHKQ